MGNKHSTNNVSIYEIIKTAKKDAPKSVRKNLDRLTSPTPSQQISESPVSNRSTRSDDSTDSMAEMMCNRSNSQVIKHHSKLSLNLECDNYDIIQDVKVEDLNAIIDHIDLMVGHRRFTAERVGNELIITIPIPKFILAENSPIRLDVYPKTQTDPDEIVYWYQGYSLDDEMRNLYKSRRIEDQSRHIVYVDGLVC